MFGHYFVITNYDLGHLSSSVDTIVPPQLPYKSVHVPVAPVTEQHTVLSPKPSQGCGFVSPEVSPVVLLQPPNTFFNCSRDN